MIFLFGVLLFLCLIIPPAAAGGIVKIACPLGLSFFALNQPAPVGADKINIPRPSRGYFLCGRSPMLPATPHAALVRLAICIGPPIHTGISPSPFPSHIAAILNIYTFFFCLIIFHQQSLLLSHNLLNCFSHFILEWPPSVL